MIVFDEFVKWVDGKGRRTRGGDERRRMDANRQQKGNYGEDIRGIIGWIGGRSEEKARMRRQGKAREGRQRGEQGRRGGGRGYGQREYQDQGGGQGRGIVKGGINRGEREIAFCKPSLFYLCCPVFFFLRWCEAILRRKRICRGFFSRVCTPDRDKAWRRRWETFFLFFVCLFVINRKHTLRSCFDVGAQKFKEWEQRVRVERMRQSKCKV